jgi:hypothetical protein
VAGGGSASSKDELLELYKKVDHLLVRVLNLQLQRTNANNNNNRSRDENDYRLLLLYRSWNYFGHHCLPRILPWAVLCGFTIMPKTDWNHSLPCCLRPFSLTTRFMMATVVVVTFLCLRSSCGHNSFSCAFLFATQQGRRRTTSLAATIIKEQSSETTTCILDTMGGSYLANSTCFEPSGRC